MKYRDIVLAIVVVALVLILFQRLRANQEPPVLTNEDISVEELENNLEEVLGREIPDDVEKVEFRAQAGFEGQGIVTRDVNKTNTLSVLADLPEISPKTYQAWVKESTSENLVSIGTLENVKGGWTLDYTSENVKNIKEVVVSSEAKVDTTIEKTVLKATFE